MREGEKERVVGEGNEREGEERVMERGEGGRPRSQGRKRRGERNKEDARGKARKIRTCTVYFFLEQNCKFVSVVEACVGGRVCWHLLIWLVLTGNESK